MDELLASAVDVIGFILTLLAPLFPMTEVAVGRVVEVVAGL